MEAGYSILNADIFLGLRRVDSPVYFALSGLSISTLHPPGHLPPKFIKICLLFQLECDAIREHTPDRVELNLNHDNQPDGAQI